MNDEHEPDAPQTPPVDTWFYEPAPPAPAAPVVQAVPVVTAGPGSRTGRRAGRVTLVASAAAVVLVAGAAGAVAGHAVWAPSAAAATQSAAAAGGTTDPNQGSSGIYGNGDGGQSFGGSPFGGSDGSDGSDGSPYGGSTDQGGSASNGSSGGADGPSDVDAIAAKVDPALVDINVTLGYQNEQAAGTGIVLTSSGEILTNNHVVDGATKISVTDIGNGKTYSASVVGYSPSHDLAVVQLKNASGLATANIASTSQVSVGQSVVAIGNAGGSGGTPASAGGAVTAVDQSITATDEGGGSSENLTGLIEVDADIEAGDSGGSLVNTDGQVIGVDTAASTGYSFGSASSAGYAIPIGTATAIAAQIEAGQSSSTVHIGATAMLGVAVSESNGVNGAAVSQVVGSAVRNAGLAAGDVITSLGGRSVTSGTDLSRLLLVHHPGDVVSLGWTDNSGQTHTANVTLASGPPS